MDDALVDVLLPVYNGASTIEDALTSLLRQTLANIKITVIDDGSTDDSPAIVERLAGKDNRITLIRQANSGVVDALNAGLRGSNAEFIARQDADDISQPSRLQIELNYLRAHPECIGVSGAVSHIDAHGHSSGHIERFPQPETANPRWVPSREPYLMHPFLMVRRSDLAAVGGYRYVFHAEDTDLYWRLLERGNLHNLSEIVGYYRMHQASISGESIVNGRIMALNSQLAALSAMRRSGGKADIIFVKEAMEEYRQARTLVNIYRLAVTQLHDYYEFRYLRVAVAAKLIELTAYRPYELEISDCHFIRGARHEIEILSEPNRRQFNRMYAAAIARLIQKGLLREAAELAPVSLYGSALGRLIATRLFPKFAIKFISRARNSKSSKLPTIERRITH